MLLNTFFWCINNISKKSSSNISPISVIAFVKSWTLHHMKNNIRYNGNANNTSVIIFLKSKVKKSQRWYFAWENLQGSFLLFIHFCSSFHFWSSFCCCSSFIVVLHWLLFNVIPHSSVDYRWVFKPILYFQPSPLQSDSRHFHFQIFRDLLTVSATVLSGRFLPYALHRYFWLNLSLSRPPWKLAVLPWRLHTDPQNTDWPICLIHSNPQFYYSERFIFKFYHILA